MPTDPTEAAAALARLVGAQAKFRGAQEDRRVAIVAAVRAEVPLREVAEAAGCSHESVRRIAAADGVVTLELGGREYPLTQRTAELLIYKLAGYAGGAFPRDVELLGAGSAWLRPAGRLASALQGAISDDTGAPIRLDQAQALALHQVLRLTAMTIPSPLSDLYEALRRTHGRAGR